MRCLIALVSPTQRASLQLLNRVNFTLRSSRWHRALLGQASREKLLQALKVAEDQLTP